MKNYAPADIRNLAVVGHQAAGKTTLTEALLFKTGALARMGSVDEGTSNLDYHHNEIERKTSIYSSLGACEHEQTKFNLIDTPGFEDFRGEVLSALEVVESALLVLRADGGVEVGTDALWGRLGRRDVPTVLVVSKMDKEHADFDMCLRQAKERLSDKAVAVQLPIGRGDSFKGVIDVVEGTAYEYDAAGNPTPIDIPADMKAAYDEARELLVNAAADNDDVLVEKYLEEGDLTNEEIIRGVQLGVKHRTLFPVCLASPLKTYGIRPLLHCIKAYMPSAAERGELAGVDGDKPVVLKAGSDAPACARVFKIAIERDAGDFSIMRVFGGEIAAGAEAYNVNRQHGERVTQLFRLEGKNREKIEKITAGDIGAAVKLKDTHNGDTLGDKSLAGALVPIEFPVPNSRVAIRAVTQGDDDKIAQGMHKLREEDPTFKFGMDPETHEQVLEGQGELHMDVLLARLKDRYHAEVSRHEPRIPYLETLKTSVEVQARHKKQSGGRGQFADVSLRFEPQPRGAGFEFVDAIVGGVVPGKFIPAVEKGLVETMERGALAGYRVIDIRATLYDGGFHAVDSSEAAFKTAAFQAIREAFQKAKAVLLEPIYTVEVKVPEEVMGDVMGDLNSRRGRIMGTEAEGHFQVVKASVPLSELYRYSTSLRSMTQGRGTHTRTFERYDEVPGDVQAKIIEQSKLEAQQA